MHFVIILWSSFCCVTRISDNWHHPVDVIGAIILTIPFAFYSVCKIMRFSFLEFTIMMFAFYFSVMCSVETSHVAVGTKQKDYE